MSPRNPDLSRRMREESKSKILSTSLELFACNGFHATSMSEIARRAGVSKGLAYSYFASKDELVVEAIRQRLDHLSDLIETIEGIEAPERRLKALIGSFIRDVENDPAIFRFYFSLVLQEGSSDAFRAAIQLLDGRIEQYLQSMRRTFESLGSLDPETDLLLFRSALLGLSLRIVLAPGSVPIDRASQRLYERFVSHTEGEGTS